MAAMLASKQGAFMGRSSFAPAPKGVASRGSLQVTALAVLGGPHR